ncbi:MAG: bifunctional nuclease family protein [Treponema sp.]|jgi:bifunctional DNase/RNase|nr:bifunctional nuclease family protein [Treponema sp.]
MLEAEIWGIAEAGDGYMVFIKPLESEYSVPIFIGQLEAQAILIGFGGISISRPLTADLLHKLAGESDFRLVRAEIRELRDNTFFGALVFARPGGGELVMDSRPSDAMALALRCKSPLFIAPEIVEEAGILADDLEAPRQSDPETQKRLLRTEMEEAVAAENYERAAEIRDLLNSLDP